MELMAADCGADLAVAPADFPKDFASVAANPAAVNKQLHLLWVGCGTDDGLFGASDSFSKFLDTSQVKHTFFKIPGAHTWLVWRQFLQEFAPQLFVASK